jgi:hypothetical protein
MARNAGTRSWQQEAPNSEIAIPTSRRAVIIGAAAVVALPVHVQAQPLDRLDLLRLQPVRFIAGLIFDIAIAVVVALVSDRIVAAIRQGREVPQAPVASRPPLSEIEFKHVNYKASIATLGIVDWREHRRRQISLRLKQSRPEDLERFVAIRDYLRRENIRIKLADERVPRSLPVPPDLELDDLFMLDYLVPEREGQEDRLKLYENLIKETGATVFDKWYG